MFSIQKTNEDLDLRHHQRRVAEYVESTIPQSALDAGTSVMAMQVACTAPGCAPLETVIVVVFPKASHPSHKQKEWIPGLPQSVIDGGHFQTRIFLPMSQVTMEHVLDVLPPAFKGGRKTRERDYIQVRNQMFLQIEQTMGSNNNIRGDTVISDQDKHKMKEGKVLMAKYLIQCLNEYIDNDCTPPSSVSSLEPEGDMALDSSIQKGIPLKGNFVIRRKNEDLEINSGAIRSVVTPNPLPTHSDTNTNNAATENTMDWRRRKMMEKSVMESLSSSTALLEKLTDRDHAPGIRKQGCPCCDPESISNIVDQMLSM
jgi:hypothetical protein